MSLVLSGGHERSIIGKVALQLLVTRALPRWYEFPIPRKIVNLDYIMVGFMVE